MIDLIRRLLALANGARQRTVSDTTRCLPDHRWVVAWNDDDVCGRGCGAVKYWPSGVVLEPGQQTPAQRRIHRSNAAHT